MWHTSIGLVLTKKCNAECDICCFECSPKKQEKMPIDMALNLVKQASEIPSIRMIAITGGEPFLYFEDMVSILTQCKDYGLSATCTTNGFWATTQEEAIKKLTTIKKLGVNHITLSVDYFHAKFVKEKNIVNILNAAKDIEIGVIINTVSTKNKRGLEYIVKNFKEEVFNCRIIELPCAPIGTALSKLKSEEFIIDNNIPDKRCTNTRILSITPDGNVYPCCSECGFIDGLCQGNINNNSLKDVINNFFNNKFCYALSKYGVKWIKKIIVKNNLPIKLKNKYVSECDLCNDIFKDSEQINCLNSFIQIEQ